MSKFISLRILASLAKTTLASAHATHRTPRPAPPSERGGAAGELGHLARHDAQPPSASRISVNRIRIEG